MRRCDATATASASTAITATATATASAGTTATVRVTAKLTVVQQRPRQRKRLLQSKRFYAYLYYLFKFWVDHSNLLYITLFRYLVKITYSVKTCCLNISIGAVSLDPRAATVLCYFTLWIYSMSIASALTWAESRRFQLKFKKNPFAAVCNRHLF